LLIIKATVKSVEFYYFMNKNEVGNLYLIQIERTIRHCMGDSVIGEWLIFCTIWHINEDAK